MRVVLDQPTSKVHMLRTSSSSADLLFQCNGICITGQPRSRCQGRRRRSDSDQHSRRGSRVARLHR